MCVERLADLVRFYSILDRLESKIGGARKLANCSGRMVWPTRGVYFFCEPGERRQESGDGFRVVRVGTHALTKEPGTRLWTRLRQHKGPAKTGVGNHRGSIFRLILGTALIARHSYEFPTWGVKKLSKDVSRRNEQSLEREVSEVLTNMPFLWLAVGDSAGPTSLRGYIERNSIALLSNYNRIRLDAPSPTWLGRMCDRERVRNSGLWNSDHVDERHSPEFLDVLDRLVSEMEEP
jgi:hypothetical protein